MKITAISDLHGSLPKNIEESDVLCICGDTIPLDIQRNFESSLAWWRKRFMKWANDQPVRHIILIGGNHDFVMDDIYFEETFHAICKSAGLSEKIHYLLNSDVIIDGVKFYGCPYTDGLPGWAFSTDSFASYICNPNTDVMLVHQAPDWKGLGTILDPYGFKWKNFGSQLLMNALAINTPRYLLCGHIHEGNHAPVDCDLYNSVCTMVNVSLKDENYKVKFKPYTFEI